MARPAQVTRSLIRGRAGNIEAVTQLPDGQPSAIAVVAHPHPLFGGTMDNKVVTSLARAFVDAGAVTWRFNFRGVGATSGAHDEGAGESEDMLAVIRHASAQHPGLPLWLSGFSFGGAVAHIASAQAIAHELILVAPAFHRMAHLQDASGSGSATTNILIIHGEKDETVPLSASFDWARPRDIPVVVVPGADHFFHQRLHFIRQIASRWLPTR